MIGERGAGSGDHQGSTNAWRGGPHVDYSETLSAPPMLLGERDKHQPPRIPGRTDEHPSQAAPRTRDLSVHPVFVK